MKTILYQPLFINPQAYFVFPSLYHIEKGDSFIEPANITGQLIINTLTDDPTLTPIILTVKDNNQVDFSIFAGKHIRIALLDSIIDSVEGVPIGNYLSQFFANLYLSYFDHWLKEDKAVKYYFRYADDMVILHSDKEYLRQLLDEIREQLGTLKLEIKSNYQIFRVEDRSISFVGYKIYHDYTLIRKNIKHKMCKKVAAMNKLKHMTYSEYRQQVCSHIGWMKHCNGINLLKKIIKYHQLIEYARSS